MQDDKPLLDLERRRCGAITAADASALKEILSEDYVHVHATGKIDDLAGHINSITQNPRVPERGKLSVRRYGNTAILIGEQINRTGGTTTTSILQQVAVLTDGTWRFVSAQVTRKA